MLLFFVSSVNAGNWQEGQIDTMGDLKDVCAPIINNEVDHQSNKLKVLSCSSFFSGVINGYLGSTAVNAELVLAQARQTTRENIASKIDTNSKIHDELISISNSMQFICVPKNKSLSVIVQDSFKTITPSLLNSNYAAYYFVVDALSRVYPCI